MKAYYNPFSHIGHAYRLFLLLVLVPGFWSSCKNPAKDLSLTVTADVFDYTLAIKLYDASNPGEVPAGATIALSGAQAANIYEISGKKKYNISDGIVSLGLLRKSNPTPGQPVSVVLDVKANGYLPLRIPVRFINGQFDRQLVVHMVNLDNPPPGVSVKKMQVPLTGNVVATAVTMETPLTGDKKESALLTIPAGTQFKDAANAVLTGTSATVTLVHFDTRHALSVNAFPNGTRSSGIIADTAGNKSSGYFQPAGTVAVTASVGNKTVTSFNQNLTLRMGVDGQQWNPATSANYLPGDKISPVRRNADVFSWQQQKPVTLVMQGSTLQTTFSFNQATVYALAYTGAACSEADVLWQSRVSGRDAYVMDVFAANDQFTPIASYVVQADSNETIRFADMPAAGVILKIYPNTPEHPVTDYTKRTPAIGTYTGAICSGATVMVNPLDREPFYFDVQGYCSNDNTYIRPTFYVEYALKGSKDFQLLGLVENGRFVTRNLDPDVTYDFRLSWNGRLSSLITRKADGAFGGTVTVEVPPGEQETYCP